MTSSRSASFLKPGNAMLVPLTYWHSIPSHVSVGVVVVACQDAHDYARVARTRAALAMALTVFGLASHSSIASFVQTTPVFFSGSLNLKPLLTCVYAAGEARAISG